MSHTRPANGLTKWWSKTNVMAELTGSFFHFCWKASILQLYSLVSNFWWIAPHSQNVDKIVPLYWKLSWGYYWLVSFVYILFHYGKVCIHLFTFFVTEKFGSNETIADRSELRNRDILNKPFAFWPFIGHWKSEKSQTENVSQQEKKNKKIGREEWRLAGDQHRDGGEETPLPQGRLDHAGGSEVALPGLDILRQLPALLVHVRPGLAHHVLAPRRSRGRGHYMQEKSVSFTTRLWLFDLRWPQDDRDNKINVFIIPSIIIPLCCIILSLAPGWQAAGRWAAGVGELDPVCVQHPRLHLQLPLLPGDPAHHRVRPPGDEPQVPGRRYPPVLPVHPGRHHPGQQPGQIYLRSKIIILLQMMIHPDDHISGNLNQVEKSLDTW